MVQVHCFDNTGWKFPGAEYDFANHGVINLKQRLFAIIPTQMLFLGNVANFVEIRVEITLFNQLTDIVQQADDEGLFVLIDTQLFGQDLGNACYSEAVFPEICHIDGTGFFVFKIVEYADRQGRTAQRLKA